MNDQQLTLGYGLCQCGCGGKTTIPKHSDRSHGLIAGVPRRYIAGHQRRKVGRGADYLVEDRGYETPCWVWQHGRANGYGRIFDDNSVVRLAHVVYWERVNGPVPEGVQLHHRCETKACVNPAHLRPLTQREHSREHARLSLSDLEEIRLACAAGEMRKDVAARYGVHPATVSRIARGLYCAQV